MTYHICTISVLAVIGHCSALSSALNKQHTLLEHVHIVQVCIYAFQHVDIVNDVTNHMWLLTVHVYTYPWQYTITGWGLTKLGSPLNKIKVNQQNTHTAPTKPISAGGATGGH